MRRLASLAFALTLLASIALVIGFLVEDSEADLENQVFTSRADRLRMVVPRGWRATDQPSYPGLLLWMMRTQPPGTIVLTAESFTRELYCSWPVPCRNQPTNTAKYVCAIRERLQAQKLRVGPVQPGPKETEAGGLPSVWFEYDDGRRFLRHAVAVTNERAVSLVLSAPTADARSAHARPFDQALRTLHQLTVVEVAQIAPPDAAIAIVPPGDGGPSDAMTLPADASLLDAGVTFQSAPTPRINPIGPCR